MQTMSPPSQKLLWRVAFRGFLFGASEPVGTGEGKTGNDHRRYPDAHLPDVEPVDTRVIEIHYCDVFRVLQFDLSLNMNAGHRVSVTRVAVGTGEEQKVGGNEEEYLLPMRPGEEECSLVFLGNQKSPEDSHHQHRDLEHALRAFEFLCHGRLRRLGVGHRFD